MLLVVVGVGQVHADGVDQQAATLVAAADDREQALRAESTRLTASAIDFAAAERERALSAAASALKTADAVANKADDVIKADAVTPLQEAAVALERLVADADDPEAVLSSPQPLVGPGAEVAQKAAVELREDDSASRAAGRAAGRVPVPENAPENAGPAPENAAENAAAAPEATAMELREPPLPLAPEPGEVIPVTPQLKLRALDLAETAAVLTAVDELATVTEEVEAAADKVIAEREAARQRAARRAAELARKISIAANSANGRIPLDALCGVSFQSGVLLRCDAAPALERLNAAYRADFGYNLKISSSYRSYSQQVSTRAAKGSLAAAPGTSNHGLGLAVDFANFGGVGQYNTTNYQWMRANAGRFGWVHPPYMQPGGSGPHEPWHWEYGTG